METKNIIRNVYLYLVSAVTLFMILFATVSLVNLGLRAWLFPKADGNTYYAPITTQQYCTADKEGKQVCPPADQLAKLQEQDKVRQDEQKVSDRQRELASNISMLIVAIPLFAYHWMTIRKDRSLV